LGSEFSVGVVRKRAGLAFLLFYYDVIPGQLAEIVGQSLVVF